MRYEHHDLNGQGARRLRVYDVEQVRDQLGRLHYWLAVTDVPCPVCADGIVRWAEAGYVPGYRLCDTCGRAFHASGTVEAPTLIQTGRMTASVTRRERHHDAEHRCTTSRDRRGT